MSIDTLTGRFAALTLLFVALAELFVLVPAVSNFRVDYLQTRLEKAQIASQVEQAKQEILDKFDIDVAGCVRYLENDNQWKADLYSVLERL